MAADMMDELSDEQIEARILKYRTTEVTLTVGDASGKPLANRDVTVRQVRHKFLFGCNAFMVGRCDKPELETAYRKRFSDLLNYATLPFYWGMYEREEGSPAARRLGQMAQWCRQKGIRAKGHPLCWHTVVPRWLEAKTAAEVEALQLARITRDVKVFAGSIDTWDVVNEAVVMRNFRQPNPISRMCKRLGRVELIKRTFAQARKANPKATLILNDYMTTARYEKLIRECLDAGVPVDVIGIQSHMHVGYWGGKKAWRVCQRFAKFGKPLHFTEATLLSGKLKTDSDWMGRHPGWNTTPAGEKRQAREAAEFYRILFSHPAVEAITWWDFSDRGAWQGAPAGFVRKDMSPKPAYDALKELIKKKWWTGRLKLTTDEAGRVRFRGFLGDYTVESTKGAAEFEVGAHGRVRTTARLHK